MNRGSNKMKDRIKLVVPPVEETVQMTHGLCKQLAKVRMYDDKMTYYYHKLKPLSIGFIGSDISEGSLDKMLEEAKRIELAGENAFKIRHGLAVQDADDEWYFIEHDTEKMMEYLEEKGDMETIEWMTTEEATMR